MLQRNAMVGIGAAQTIAGNPKRYTPRRKAGPRARTNNTKRKHTSKARSSRIQQEAPNSHRSSGNKATHSTQEPEAQRKKLHETAPWHERRNNQGIAPTATTEATGKPRKATRHPATTSPGATAGVTHTTIAIGLFLLRLRLMGA